MAFFDGIYEFIPPAFHFNGRNKRPPKDPVNVLLSFGYTLLFQYMESFILSQGLHPAIGCYHERMARFSCLAADLMEEFRSPIVDGLVLNLVNLGVIKPGDFTMQPGETPYCLMSNDARRRFLLEFSSRLKHPYQHADFDHPVTLAGCMWLQVRRYVQALRHPEMPYIPFIFGSMANKKIVTD